MPNLSTAGAHRILIADDQAAFRQLLRQRLNTLAAEVIECSDGAEAVDTFDRDQPDWVVLDWIMPRVDGLAATRAIRARHPHARVVILSAHCSPLLVREAADAG